MCFLCFRLGFNNFMKIFLCPKDKLKKKTIKDDEDIIKDKRNNNEGKVYPLLHILKVFDWQVRCLYEGNVAVN